MKIGILPSAQHLNPYSGLPGVTEEKWAVATCNWLRRRLSDLGAEARIFHIAGAGSKSTDELARMIAEAVAWKPDYMLSVHSDAVGDAKQTGVLMLMAREADRSKGQALGKAIAAAVGLPYKATWVYGQEARKIMYLKALRDHSLEGSLVEVGEHATAAEAKWNWEHTKQIGEGIADALADYLGLKEGQELNDQERTMLEDLHLKARQDRVTNVIHSNDAKALLAQMRGDPAKADQLLEDAYIAGLEVKEAEGLELTKEEEAALEAAPK